MYLSLTVESIQTMLLASVGSCERLGLGGKRFGWKGKTLSEEKENADYIKNRNVDGCKEQ